MREKEGAPPAWFTAHEDRLRVGMRVRIRLNGECDRGHESEQHGATGYIDYHITQEELDGDNRTATDPEDHVTIESINYHVWSVTYDDPRRVPMLLVGVRFGWATEDLFAALELEPLDS